MTRVQTSTPSGSGSPEATPWAKGTDSAAAGATEAAATPTPAATSAPPARSTPRRVSADEGAADAGLSGDEESLTAVELAGFRPPCHY
nr:hypothetical protein [Saccharomonospora azurea]